MGSTSPTRAACTTDVLSSSPGEDIVIIPLHIPTHHNTNNRPRHCGPALWYNIVQARRPPLLGDEAARGHSLSFYRKGVMAGMKGLELIEKLLHYVAVAGAYATVFEMIVQLVRYWLSH